jgi:1-acyl-sn-glycerol-3-phosphate acyltransferase
MKVFSYLLSPIFTFVFFMLSFIFRPLQWIALNVFGYKGHKFIVDSMNWFLVKSLLVLAKPVKVENKLPMAMTLIFISNHEFFKDLFKN